MKIGKVPENVLKRSVLRQIKTNREEIIRGAGVGEDCAIFSFSDKAPFMTCVQEAAVTTGASVLREATAWKADEGTTLENAVMSGRSGAFTTMAALLQRCANNLAAGGARMRAVMITLLLPEETEEAGIKALMREAADKCGELKVSVGGGQTRISSAVKAPLAVLTGYGSPFDKDWRAGKPAPGQDIVISKWIGLEGTAVLARRNREKLLARYPAYFVEEAAGFDRWLSVIPEAATAIKSGVCAIHDASEGGIFGALWELAERAGVGLTIDLKKLPLRQETVEVCEYCNVNPYELLSGGCLVMTSGDGPSLAAALEAEGIPAVIAGKITDSRDRIILKEDEVRYMDRPKQDELYRWLAEEERSGNVPEA